MIEAYRYPCASGEARFDLPQVAEMERLQAANAQLQKKLEVRVRWPRGHDEVASGGLR